MDGSQIFGYLKEYFPGINARLSGESFSVTYYLWDENKKRHILVPQTDMAGYMEIQEVISFFKLRQLDISYEDAKKLANWCSLYYKGLVFTRVSPEWIASGQSPPM